MVWLAEAAAQMAGAGTLAAFSRKDEREADRYGVAYTVLPPRSAFGTLSVSSPAPELPPGVRNESASMTFAHGYNTVTGYDRPSVSSQRFVRKVF